MPTLRVTVNGETSEIDLDSKASWTAGRNPGLDLTLPVKEASREHLRIGRLKGGGWGVQDLGSTNGTLLNGEPVKGARLSHKDTLAIGRDCTLEFLDPPAAPVPTRSRSPRRSADKRPAAPVPKRAREKAAADEPPPEPAEPEPEPFVIDSESQLNDLLRDPDGFDRTIADPEHPVHFGPYEIRKRLAQGGMGVVFRARHRKQGFDAALKVLRTEMVDAKNIARFKQEAWAISAFDHPNIVKVRDLAQHGGMHYIALDFVDGDDLLAVGFQRTLTFWQVAETIDKVADVLRLVHARNIWHRDIKPQNVMMDRAGEIKLIDFGIAAVEREQDDSTKTAEGLIMGTPAFLSPEQAARGRMGPIDGRADLYSLGAVMYYRLTGRRPFTGRTPLDVLQANLRTMPPHPHDVEPLSPPELGDICMKLLQKRPEDRYQTAEEVQQGLAHWRRTEDGKHELDRHKKIMKLRAKKKKLEQRGGG